LTLCHTRMGSERVPITSVSVKYQLPVGQEALDNPQSFGAYTITRSNLLGFLLIHCIIGLVQAEKKLVPRFLIQEHELLCQSLFNRCRARPFLVDAAAV
jgi:hypothetical protein